MDLDSEPQEEHVREAPVEAIYLALVSVSDVQVPLVGQQLSVETSTSSSVGKE